MNSKLMEAAGPGISIRAAEARDRDAIWRMLEPAIRGGEVFALPRDMDAAAALAFWAAPGHEVFVAEADGRVAGVYFICPNQQGGGSHVANGGYATAVDVQGRGIARAMCAHSLAQARARGFAAMQFNFVISSNDRAVRLWRDMGFEIVGRLPQAFAHPRLGHVDVLVMFRAL
jgi:ribosomal protein S18 acetylase RimI-like enzyme